jgi:hypothetical protein
MLSLTIFGNPGGAHGRRMHVSEKWPDLQNGRAAHASTPFPVKLHAQPLPPWALLLLHAADSTNAKTIKRKWQQLTTAQAHARNYNYAAE